MKCGFLFLGDGSTAGQAVRDNNSSGFNYAALGFRSRHQRVAPVITDDDT